MHVKLAVTDRWHVGFCKWELTPTYRGFDTFLGFYSGGQDYYTHMAGDRGGKQVRVWVTSATFTKLVSVRRENQFMDVYQVNHTCTRR